MYEPDTGGTPMELEERIEQLEIELALIKVDIKQVLVELKELVLRDQNPLSEVSTAASPLDSEDLINMNMPTLTST